MALAQPMVEFVPFSMCVSVIQAFRTLMMIIIISFNFKNKYINTINVSIINTFAETSQIPGIAVYAIDISNKYRTLLIGCILVGPSGSLILDKRSQNLPQLQLSHGSLLRINTST